MQWLDTAKSWVLKFIDIGIALLALAIIVQLLFGSAAPFMGNIADNIMKFIATFGGQGLVGLVAIGVVLYVLNRK